MSKTRLEPRDLYTSTDFADIGYESTAETDTSKYDVIGQTRALEAIEFGVGMQRDNYNLYLAGSKGLGKHDVIQRVLEQHAEDKTTPTDWCYIDNYEEFYKPLALEVPAGIGMQLRADMAQLVSDLLIAVPAAYESDEYHTRAQEVEGTADERKENAFAELSERADEQGITMIDTPTGYTIVPVSNGKPVKQDEFKKLSEKKQKDTDIFTCYIDVHTHFSILR
jgi:hypothetical protein